MLLIITTVLVVENGVSVLQNRDLLVHVIPDLALSDCQNV